MKGNNKKNAKSFYNQHFHSILLSKYSYVFISEPIFNFQKNVLLQLFSELYRQL